MKRKYIYFLIIGSMVLLISLYSGLFIVAVFFFPVIAGLIYKLLKMK